MARLVVLTSAELADGFQLAGCTALVATPGPRAEEALRQLTADVDVGLLLVTADLWSSIGERQRAGLEAAAAPVVAPIPAGIAAEGDVRGQLLGEMLQRAIGFRIELSGGASR